MLENAYYNCNADANMIAISIHYKPKFYNRKIEIIVVYIVLITNMANIQNPINNRTEMYNRFYNYLHHMNYVCLNINIDNAIARHRTIETIINNYNDIIRMFVEYNQNAFDAYVSFIDLNPNINYFPTLIELQNEILHQTLNEGIPNMPIEYAFAYFFWNRTVH